MKEGRHEVIREACRVREAMDAVRALQVGDRVRCLATRDVGHVVSLKDDGLIKVRYESDGKVCAERKETLAVVATCHCGVPVTSGGPCMAGHVAFLEGLPRNLALGDYLTCESDREERVIGVLLVGMIGDALGAPFEGHGSKDVRHTCGGGLPDRFIPGTHMGLRQAGSRYGQYTDDTNTCLALADALVANGGRVDAKAIARNYATFFQDHLPQRGLPDSAKKVQLLCSQGANIRLTGMSSFCFGSFANGSAMRISPLACLRFADSELAGLVSECCASSHIHPEAIDAAVVQAEAVRYLLSRQKQTIDKTAFLIHLVATATTDPVKSRLLALVTGLQLIAEDAETTDAEFLETCTEVGFQLYAPDAIATAVWFFLRHSTPEECLIHCVALGGDCDTTGAMLGAMLGAAFGCSWIPVRWFAMLENGQWGRDYAIDLARRLARVSDNATCADEEFVARPLHSYVSRVIPILADKLKQEPKNLVDRYNRDALGLPATQKLWNDFFAVVEHNGRVRFDVATCLASFFADKHRAIQTEEGLDSKAWRELYATL